MSDLISRKMALDALENELKYGAYVDYCGLDTAYDIIENIPSADPEERTAKVNCKRYIGTSTGIVGEIKVTGICENCHNAVVDRYSFCPSCGARLEWK